MLGRERELSVAPAWKECEGCREEPRPEPEVINRGIVHQVKRVVVTWVDAIFLLIWMLQLIFRKDFKFLGATLTKVLPVYGVASHYRPCLNDLSFLIEIWCSMNHALFPGKRLPYDDGGVAFIATFRIGTNSFFSFFPDQINAFDLRVSIAKATIVFIPLCYARIYFYCSEAQ